MQQPYRTTLIDYDIHRKDATRLRIEARNRALRAIGMFAVAAVCAPWRACAAFAGSWQSGWHSPSIDRDRPVVRFSLYTDPRK